jgi:ABC-type glycerol-3-phosphate transport system substrate-binding protein
MNRTRWVFVLIVGAALAVVAAGVLVPLLREDNGDGDAGASGETIEVRVLTALPVEPWVRAAADQFNAEEHTIEGHPIRVTVVPMDGLSALSKWDREEFPLLGDRDRDSLTEDELQRLADFPTVWIPDSRYLVELVNAAYKEKLGRDVFLTDGEYRARPVATSLLAWGIFESRTKVLEDAFGEISWQAIHDAASAEGGWPQIAEQAGLEDPDSLNPWGFFKLAIPHPRKNAGGMHAIIAAAGEYYDSPRIDVADLTNDDFLKWLEEALLSVTDFSAASQPGENLALFGYTTGDVAQLLEADILVNMAGIQTRAPESFLIRYPRYVTWFDFPFTVWMGPETTALEKNAALEFEQFLLSKETQEQALNYGLRPVHPEVPVDSPDSLFTRWQDQGATTFVERTTAMRSPDRDVLLALLAWFDRYDARR